LDPVPESAPEISGNGTSSASLFWGMPASSNGQSGYNFTTASTPISYEVPPQTPVFIIGTWSHYNNPIYKPSLDTIRLVISAEISIDGVSQGIMNFYFDFVYNETPNNENPCANGIPNNIGVNIKGCADIVDVNYNTLSDSFLLDGTLFTLTLTSDSSHFETVESSTNTFPVNATIVATSTVNPVLSSLFRNNNTIYESTLGFVRLLDSDKIREGGCSQGNTTRTVVPEPSSLVLVASGLLGIGITAKKRKKTIRSQMLKDSRK
jgi:hypothetical protein